MSEKLDILTPYLQARLAFYPNLVGEIMTLGKGAAGNHSIEPLNRAIERNGGIAIMCLMLERNQRREGIIVTQVGKFTEQARMFAALYQLESSWLD